MRLRADEHLHGATPRCDNQLIHLHRSRPLVLDFDSCIGANSLQPCARHLRSTSIREVQAQTTHAMTNVVEDNAKRC